MPSPGQAPGGREPADLAILGGEPAFSEPLHVGRPGVPDRGRLLERINGALDRRWLTNAGPLVKELEQRLAEYLGVRHCIAMANGTVALEIVIRAAGLEGEVIVPAFTFVATAHALQWQAIRPVFADIDPRTHNLDPESVERMITPRTTGIIGVHVWGRPCDAGRLEEIARRRGLRLLFDAAHAFGSSYDGRMVGGLGDAEVFSFHATKFFNTFEGGAVATNDDELARTVRLMKNFGFAGIDDVIHVGTNGKMSEISAAMGLTSLEALDSAIDTNRRRYDQYLRELRDVPGIAMVEYDASERRNYQYVVLEIDADVVGLTRDELVATLWAENVRARRYFFPGVHRMEPYRSLYPDAGTSLPATERLVDRVICLPTGSAVEDGDVARVCAIIRTAIGLRDRVRAACAASPES